MSLQRLNVAKCSALTERGLISIRNLTKLRSLNISSCGEMLRNGMDALLYFSNLRHLNLANSNSNSASQRPEAYSSLRSLTIKSLDLSCSGITDSDIERVVAPSSLTLDLETELEPEVSSVAYLKHQLLQLVKKQEEKELRKHKETLSSLSLVSCNALTDLGLSFVAHYVNLTLVNLNFCQNITDRGIEYLTTLTALQQLNLSCCTKLTNSCLSYISKFQRMERLFLASCGKITDGGLIFLKPVISLVELDLSFCDISDFGVKELAALTRLQSLKLKQCHITTKALQELLKNSLTNVSDIQF